MFNSNTLTKRSRLFILSSAFAIISCNAKEERVNAEAEIREILKSEQTAHLSKNDSLMTAAFADTIIQVNRGQVIFSPLSQARARFANYFRSSDIVKWDDTAPPIIRFSDDNKTAFAILQKLVITKDAGKATDAVYDTTNFAWLSVYQKIDGRWRHTATVSTNK